MRVIDVFNGDADGLCALQQLRLAEPAESVLVTGVKRDIALLGRVRADPGDRVTVLDVSLDRNRAALAALLEAGVRVRWFDHHDPGGIPSHPGLEPHIDTDPAQCTSAIVDAHLGGRFRAWAVVAAFGDNLAATALRLAGALGLPPGQIDTLRELGESINYNAYGESEADLLIAPAALYARMRGHEDPLRFAERDPIVGELAASRGRDMARADALEPLRARESAAVYVLPDADWSRRVNGLLANRLARADPERAHAVLVPVGRGLMASVRAPIARPHGAGAFCRRFGGGGREAAGGVEGLPPDRLEAFVHAFLEAF